MLCVKEAFLQHEMIVSFNILHHSTEFVKELLDSVLYQGI